MPILNVPGEGLVDYLEVPENSPVYLLGNNHNSRVERTFIIKWADRATFVKGVLGYPQVVETGLAAPYNKYISRVLPMSMPDLLGPSRSGSQGDPWLFASQITRMVGVGPKGTYDPVTEVPAYEEAKVTVLFEPFTYKLVQDQFALQLSPLRANFLLPDEATFKRFITRMARPSGETVRLPRGFMKWVQVANPKPKHEGFLRYEGSMELMWVWHQVPEIPTNLHQYVGVVNKFDFADSRQQYRAGTLLLLGGEIRPYRIGSGAFVYDISYRVKYKEPLKNRGWGFLLRYIDSSGKAFYRKLTDSGQNDEQVIRPQEDPYGVDPDTDYREFGFPENVGRSINRYADFEHLFQLDLPELF